MKRQWLNKQAEWRGPRKITNSIKREDEWTELHWHLLVHISALVLLLPLKIATVMGKNDTLNSINPSKIPATSTTFIHHLLPCCTLWSSGQDLLGKKFLYLYKSKVYFFFLFFFLLCFEAVFQVTGALCGLPDLQRSCADGQCMCAGWLCTACTPNATHVGHHSLRCCIPAPLCMHLVNLVTHWTSYVSIDQLYSTYAVGLMSPRCYKFTV